MSTELPARALWDRDRRRQAAPRDDGRPWSDSVLADLAEPAVLFPATVTVAELDARFRADDGLQAVVVTGPQGPVLVERGWLDAVLTGRLGYGRLLHARSALQELAPPATLVLQADTPLVRAAAAVMDRRDPGSVFDVVVVTGPHDRIRIARVGPIFECLAQHYAFQSMHDPLTDLPNRLHLMEVLRRLDRDAVLMYVDLDRFKEVNDLHGHAAGDQVLIEFSRRLRSLVRPGDLVARLGGDEFAVLTGTAMTQHASSSLADRLVGQAATPFRVSVVSEAGVPLETVVTIGASVGIAHTSRPYAAGEGATQDMLLKRADLAMYRAKAHGRGRFAHFEPGLLRPDSARTAQSRRVMERRLRSAIAAGALRLHYQPIVELPSGRITGAEALCRWQDAELGAVPPDEFITLAEQTGLILDLGRWVLHTACHEAARWPRTGGGCPPSVSVNMSAVQLAQPSIVEQVRAALDESGLEPGRLCLEITETAAIGDLVEVGERLRQLRELGIRLALDDFGTGHSSLTMLRSLPLNLVKIDRSFVQGITVSAQDALLVRLVIDTAHTLGLRVCAEGIEDVEQARQLSTMGADLAQGWYFGRPEPPSARLDERLAATATASSLEADRPSLLLGSSDQLILVSSPDRLITYASASYRNLLGWMPGDLVGTTIEHYLDPPTVAAIGSGRPLPGLTEDGLVTHRVRHRDGSYRWLESRTQVLRDELGEAREALTISQDVTDKITARQALRESETQFRHAFDESPIGMTLTGLDERFLRVNRAFAGLIGRDAGELLSLHIADITHPADVPAQHAQTAVLADGAQRRVEFGKRLLRRDGSVLPVRIRATVIADGAGRRAYVLSDVSLLDS
jgi:diguanylate cyclase (GGDEF)-like protein/PAS domain S-box-containing protein